MEKLVEFGWPGFLCLVVLAILVPIVSSFAGELKASRKERVDMREEQTKERDELRHDAKIVRDTYDNLICNHITSNTEALTKVREALDSVCRKLNGDR